jgi:perosamine synthetase
MIIGSMPRLRLYTTLGQYARVLLAFVFGTWRRGCDIQLLEQKLVERTGARHAIFTNMARIGIYLAVKHTIRPGQKVILSPYTITEVVNMVVVAGGVPLFADLDVGTCNISAQDVERLLLEEHNVGAVMVTHFYGLACDVERIRKSCSKRGIPLLEDAAQAFGATIKGRSVGTFGRVGIYSFGLYKNLNSFYGGAVVTDDGELAALIRAEIEAMDPVPMSFFVGKVISGAITDFITWPPFFRLVTFNIFRYGILNDVDAINNKLKIDINPRLFYEMPKEYMVRPSQLQARLILLQLSGLDGKNAARRQNARRYREGLKDIAQLTLPPEVDDEQHIYWYFPIQYKKREELVRYAIHRGRDITLSYHRNCAGLECFAEFSRKCDVARKTADAVIYLPTYPAYSKREIDATVAVIRDYFNGR